MGAIMKLIVIVGPTASGKTAWAVELAKRFDGEIVSADSRQVYRGMDIGTAKEKDIHQHLVDIVNPGEIMNVSQYKALAIEKIRGISSCGKIPFLVGGTAQYIYAVVDNWEIPSVPPQAGLREALEKKTLPELLSLLKGKDPEGYGLVDKKNKRRVIRALEVVITSGEPFSKQRRKGQPLFDVMPIGIEVPREELNRRIDVRVDRMMDQGLIAEVRKLTVEYGWDAPGMNGIGYRQFKAYTEGGERLEDAVLRLKHDTRDVAKRQMTWFRRDKRTQWARRLEEAEKSIQSFLA